MNITILPKMFQFQYESETINAII